MSISLIQLSRNIYLFTWV